MVKAISCSDAGKEKGCRSVGWPKASIRFCSWPQGGNERDCSGRKEERRGDFALLPFEVGHSEVIDSSWKKELP